MNILEKIKLTKIKGGSKWSRTLFVGKGSENIIFWNSKKQILSNAVNGEIIANSIHSKPYFKDTVEEYNFIHNHDTETGWIECSNYPKRLRNCERARTAIF